MLNELPDDCLFEIFSFLNIKKLGLLSKVSKRFNHIVERFLNVKFQKYDYRSKFLYVAKKEKLNIPKPLIYRIYSIVKLTAKLGFRFVCGIIVLILMISLLRIILYILISTSKSVEMGYKELCVRENQQMNPFFEECEFSRYKESFYCRGLDYIWYHYSDPRACGTNGICVRQDKCEFNNPIPKFYCLGSDQIWYHYSDERACGSYGKCINQNICKYSFGILT